ncbi:MAG: hypothetical protein ACQEXV_17625 [Bacillota bacterium]
MDKAYSLPSQKRNPDYIFIREDYTKKTATGLKELETNPVWKG